MSAFLIIGGSDGDEWGGTDDTSQIAKFKDGAWFHAGYLKRARRVSFCSLLFLNNLSTFKEHRAQWLDNTLVVVGGGAGFRWTESCTLDNGEFECVDISPRLKSYEQGVAFTFTSQFCQHE